MSSEISNLYEFEGFLFDAKTGKLWLNDELILLSPKAGDLLKLLLERPGQFVSKEEIFDSVWADTFVEDGVLTQNIYTLRKALGTDAANQPLIENRTRLGYRITVPVSVSANGSNGNPHANGTSDTIEEIGFANGAAAGQSTLSRRSRKAAVIMAIGMIALTTIGFFGYRIFRPRIVSYFRKPIGSVHYQSLTNTGNIWTPTLSPDGNFAAYERQKSLYLEDIATNKEIKLEIPNVTSFLSLKFSPDGNFLLFRASDTYRNDANVLQVSRFGGETKLVLEKVWGSFGVSHDGKQIVFTRNNPEQTRQTLTTRDIETGVERELSSVQFPEMYLYNCAPEWSPDGRKIAYVVENFVARKTSLFILDLASGRQEEVKAQRLKKFEQIAWLPEGDALLASASEGGKFFHLWKIFQDGGDVQQVTNGLNTFGSVAISSDGKKVMAMQTVENSNLFVTNSSDLKDQKQLTTGNTNNVGQAAVNWAGDNKLVYVAYSEENPMANLWSVNIADNSRQALTAAGDYHCEAPSVSVDGQSIYFTTTQSPFVNAWRIDSTGGNLKQITTGQDGWRMNPQVSADGKYLYYIFRDRDGGAIKRMDLSSNAEETVLEKGAANPVASLSLAPDGSRVVFLHWSSKVPTEDDKTNFQFCAVSTANPADLQCYDIKLLNQAAKITSDSQAFDYVSWDGNKTMIMRQRFEGGPPQEIYALEKGRIFNFAWSKNGDRLAISQGNQKRDIVLLSNID